MVSLRASINGPTKRNRDCGQSPNATAAAWPPHLWPALLRRPRRDDQTSRVVAVRAPVEYRRQHWRV